MSALKSTLILFILLILIVSVSYSQVSSIIKIDDELDLDEINSLSLDPFSEDEIKPSLGLSAGYGQSYGGLGVSGQIYPIPELGLHAGLGYFPASAIFPEFDFVPDVILFNMGIRLYPPLELDPFYFYGDLIFGGIGVAAEQLYYYDNWYGTYYEEKWEVLIGPSALLGGEIRFELSENIAGGCLGGLGLAYALNDIDWADQKIFITLDIGVCLYITRP